MKYKLIQGTPDALVIHCSDPRFQDAFRDFVRDELKVKMPMLITLPGATSHFGVQAALPKNWHALKTSIGTMAGVHRVGRCVVIDHDDCKGYMKVAKHFGGVANINNAQKKHLRGMATFIQSEFLPHTTFELYQARIVGVARNEVEFEKVL